MQSTTDSPAPPRALTPDEEGILRFVHAADLSFVDAVDALAARAAARRAPEPEQPDPPARPFDRFYAEARPLAVDVVRSAFEDFASARERLAEARRRFRSSEAYGVLEGPEIGEWDKYIVALESFEGDARRRVVAAVLLATGRVAGVEDAEDQDAPWEPVGFCLDSEVLVVHPDPAAPHVPRLMVVEDFDSEDAGNAMWKPEG